MVSNTTELSGEQKHVVNGKDAEKGRYPYVATLQSVFRHECGGALVAPDLVVTAAHCVDNYLFEILLGRRSMSDPDIERYGVIDKLIHPKNVPNFDSFDIALLKLHRASTIIPVRLNADPTIPLDETSKLTVLGWGNDGSGYYPDLLQEAVVQYVPNDVCKEAGAGDATTSYEPWLKDDMICALGDNTDACAGDSGGPLIVKGDNSSEDLLVGTVSWGILCAVYPGVYSRVSFTYDWLRSTICNESADPPAYLNCGNQPTPAPDTEAPTAPTSTPTKATNEPTIPPSWPKTLPPTDQTTFAPTTAAPVPTVATTAAPVFTVPTTAAPVLTVPTTAAPVPTVPTTTAPVVNSFPTPTSLRPSVLPSSSPTNVVTDSPSFESGAVAIPSTSAPSLLERVSKPTSTSNGCPPIATDAQTSGGSSLVGATTTHWALVTMHTTLLLGLLFI
jgi:trypsin